MTMSLMFEKLGARLHNNLWSWGAKTESERLVYLRVWEDEKKIIDGKYCVNVLARESFEGKKNLGYEERVKQVELVKEGAECFLIVCVARDTNARPRKVAYYDKATVYPTKGFIEHDGDLWIEFGVGVPLELHMARYQPPVLWPAA